MTTDEIVMALLCQGYVVRCESEQIGSDYMWLACIAERWGRVWSESCGSGTTTTEAVVDLLYGPEHDRIVALATGRL